MIFISANMEAAILPTHQRLKSHRKTLKLMAPTLSVNLGSMEKFLFHSHQSVLQLMQSRRVVSDGVANGGSANIPLADSFNGELSSRKKDQKTMMRVASVDSCNYTLRIVPTRELLEEIVKLWVINKSSS